MKQPDPKKHQIISFVKSIVRILACIAGVTGHLQAAFIGLAFAEVIGIYEELV